MRKKTGFLEVYNGKLFIHPDASDYHDKRVLVVDLMNDYDNSLNIARDYINSIGVDEWYESSTIDLQKSTMLISSCWIRFWIAFLT